MQIMGVNMVCSFVASVRSSVRLFNLPAIESFSRTELYYTPTFVISPADEGAASTATATAATDRVNK